MGKPGGCDQTVMKVLTRVTSIALQYGVPPEVIIRQLRGSSCCPMYDHQTLVLSPSDAIGIALERILTPDREQQTPDPHVIAALPATIPHVNGSSDVADLSSLPKGTRRCPDCNGFAVLQEGCLTCHNCGWSKC